MTYRRIQTALAALVAMMGLAGCADGILQTENVYDRFGPEGKAFISISLATPDAEVNTRAATFADGDEAEYAIGEAVIMIFGSTSATPNPGQLFFRAVSKITQFDASSGIPASNRITQSHTKVIRIAKSDIRDGEHLFAFALVNGTHYLVDEENNTISFDDYEDPDDATKTLYRNTFQNVSPNNDDYSFQTLMNIKNSDFKTSSGYFVMTNAPMANQGRDNYNSSTIAITYLPEILSSKIFPTEQEAKDNPATEINVERMAVKLTVKGSETMSSTNNALTTDPSVKFDYDNIWWCPDQRNTRSYTVRHVSTDYLGYQAGTKGLRFLDDTPTSAGQYRIHWGEDYNYNYQVGELGTDDEGKQKTEVWGSTVSATTWNNASTSYDGQQRGPNNTQYYFDSVELDGRIDNSNYCHENTMNELGLTQGRTTRIEIRIPFIVGKNASNEDVKNESFYTLSTVGQDVIFLCDGKVRYYDMTNPKEETVTTAVAAKAGHTVQEKILEYVSSLASFTTWRESLSDAAKALPIADMFNVIMFNGVQKQGGESYILPAYGKAKVLLMLNTTNVADPDDQAKFKAAFCNSADNYQGYKVYEHETIQTADNFHYENDLDRLVNSEMTINYYEKGYAYYKVLVRHFGDDEVAGYVSTEGSAYDKVYPAASRAQNYLGRYGMLRNTWYTITLNGVRHIGYSDDVPLPPDTPDDEVDNYLSVKVLVNKWAQRGQRNTL